MQPRTPKQTFNRGSFTAGSSAWRYLTDAERTAWNDYAAQIQRSDSLGSSYTPTGAALFTACVTISGDATITDPPTLLPSYVLQVTAMTYTGPAPGPEAFTFHIGLTSANNHVIVETSGPVSPGITSAAAVRQWRSLPNGTSNTQKNLYPMTGNDVSILTNYNVLFPSPVTGQVIWFRFHEVFNDGVNDGLVESKLFQTFRFLTP